MRVQLTTWFEGGNPGDVIDVDDVQGRVMVSDGQARPVADDIAEPAPEPEPPAPTGADTLPKPTPTDAAGITPIGTGPVDTSGASPSTK